MGNKSSVEESEASYDPNEYFQLLEDSSISGNTWPELSANFKRHIQDEEVIQREWQKLEEKEEENNCNESSSLYTAAFHPLNIDKNRYINILPFDSTRVKLSQKEGMEGSDYINANFVSCENRHFICCQAPLDSTIEDFYRMLWEAECKIIVMLTKHVEGGRIKASVYLPETGETPLVCGDFILSITKEESMNNGVYVVREFTLKKNSEVRQLTQFHFLAWPDFGVPDEPKELLDMIVQVNKLEKEINTKSSSPTVVHCSAGIGRTGTYIIINSTMELISESIKKDKLKPPPLSIMKSVHSLRGMRGGMVNHIDQYFYCYNAIAAHIDHMIREEWDATPSKEASKDTQTEVVE